MKNPQHLERPEEYIKAMTELISQYKQALNLGISKQHLTRICPLCTITFNTCSSCPWRVILSKGCSISSPYLASDSKVIKGRIRQLQRWIKIYKEATL